MRASLLTPKEASDQVVQTMQRAPESRGTVGAAATPGFAIEELERVEAPSLEVFVRRHLRPRRPVVLTGLTTEWRPAPEWTLARMAREYGSAQVVAAALSGGMLHDDPRRGVVFRRIELGEFVASLGRPGPAAHYVMAPTWNFPASFRDDYRVPPYCEGAGHLRAKVWLGKRATVTPLHRDVPHNLHVHLSGRKRWLLFAPGESSRVYRRGLLSGMPNFAQVDPERPDYERYPRFRQATALGATLDSGETLFIPHGWWHHTRSLDDAVSMNFWWGGQVVRLVSLASSAFKRARGIRRDEWA
jgi:lysine-specific demethylase 8